MQRRTVAGAPLGAVVAVLLVSIAGLLVPPALAPAGPGVGAAPPVAPNAAAPAVAFPAERPAAGGLPPPNWGNLSIASAPPAGVQNGALAYDAADGVVVWVGGPPGPSQSFQTWTFAGGAWTNRSGTVGIAPPYSVGPALAYDPDVGAVVLAGAPGTGTATLTWEFHANAWTNVTSSVTGDPPARQAAAMSWDPGDADLVLFGGVQRGTFLADTWTFNGTAWQSVTASIHPSARADAGTTAGTAGGVLLAGGQSYTGGLGDTWEFSNGSWTQLAASGAPRDLATGPDALTYAPGGRVIGFDGSPCAPSSAAPCNGTYEWNGSAWAALSSQNGPAGWTGTALAYDAADGYVLAFGGSVLGRPINSTWALGGPVAALLTISPPIPQPPGFVTVTTAASGGYGIYTYTYTDRLDCPPKNVSSFICALDGDDFGNTTVHVNVTDQLGNVSSASSTSDVHPELIVSISAASLTLDVGQPLTLTAAIPADSVAVNYTWSGLPSVCTPIWTASIDCVPDSPGFYPFTCTVTDTLGAVASSAVLPLVIDPYPEVLATPSAQDVAPGTPVTFHSAVLGGTAPFSYAWAFGDGETATGANATHAYLAPGNYTVNVTVTDATGASSTWADPAVLQVVAPLTVRVSVAGGPWTAPATVPISATAAGGRAPYSFRWSGIGVGLPNTASVDPVVSTPGTYQVVVVVTDAENGTVSGSTSFTVAEASAGGSTSGTGSGSASLVDLGLGVAVALAAGVAVGFWVGRRRVPPTPTADPPPPDDLYG